MQRKRSQALGFTLASPRKYEAEVEGGEGGWREQEVIDFPPQYQRVNISGEHFTGESRVTKVKL